ncbi:single-stranded-DNA-specific exonuclease RecJ [Megalodesulfovibrio paquesii]
MTALHAQKTWEPRPHKAEPDQSGRLEAIAAELSITPALARLLWQRGFTSAQAMDRHLSPGLKHLENPAHWPMLEDAAQCVLAAVERQSPLAIWGDYDADGVTATALLTSFFRSRDIPVTPHIPVRMEDGYGVNIPGIERLHADGVRTLITVDCGIADVAALGRARELGMEVVVTDHHLPGASLPPAAAICNPRLGGCPCDSMGDLAGVGVAFYLAASLNRRLPGPQADVRSLLDLVALGTLADVVPLSGVNRILSKNGLLLIAEGARPGMAALKEAAGYGPAAALTGGSVAFNLAPRINAAGRMGRAQVALDCLLARDKTAAAPLARLLDEMNRDRRAEEERILQEALDSAASQPQLGLVLCGEGWHEGVIGIVASRVVEAFHKPTVVLSREPETGRCKGSGRSVPGFDLYKGLTRCAEVLTRYGGHPQAAGMTLDESNLERFRSLFHEAVLEQLGPTPPGPRLHVDGQLAFAEVDHLLLRELELLQPFGIGNPEPVFVSPPVEVLSRKTFGQDNRHVRLMLRDKAAGLTLRAKAWRMGEVIPEQIIGQKVRLAFVPRIDSYGGLPSIELELKDLAPA